MKNKIGFIPFEDFNQTLPFNKIKEVESDVTIPLPAKKFLPEWYTEKHIHENKNIYSTNAGVGLTFKACSPFLDALTAGYMFFLDQDIQVSCQPTANKFSWKSHIAPISVRPKTSIPTPTGYSDEHYGWNMNFGIILPKGYSYLLTHPLNRTDLPFFTASGIVDEEVPWNGTFSFWLKDGFEGIIKKGTPIAQIIPFKREDWKSERRVDLIDSSVAKLKEKNKVISGYYKKFIRQNKSYE